MATQQLPCDGEGICMICKAKPSEQESITCKTCVTPWHITCLSSKPETLQDTLTWECPDCVPIPTTDSTPDLGFAGSLSSSSQASDLIAAIRAIQSDESLNEEQKAKKRQKLMSNGKGDVEEEIVGSRNGDDDAVLGGFSCSFCMLLPERPVTTPCGHNFCLKCFQKWIGQGKRTCAKCRATIPAKMASQPRINASLVDAIRHAKNSKVSSSSAVVKVSPFIHNQQRPDKAFTTERAKKTGKANASSGKIFVTCPEDHFGPILAEHDPVRNTGVLVGESWEDRLECRQWMAHRPHVAGICGQSDYGAQSVALSGGYEDDEDHGEWFLYTGSGGRDLSGNKRTNKSQSFDQKFDKMNEALRVSCKKGYPVRVVRSHKEKRSAYAPESGVRYDGVYRIEKCWRKVGIQGYKVCRYLFVRCDDAPAPWTSDEHGDRPRPLPDIDELKEATDVTERKSGPSWDFDEEDSLWKWKKAPPASQKKPKSDGEKRTRKSSKGQDQKQRLRALSCMICKKVLNLPVTAPCSHNFCKSCIEATFAGKTHVRERIDGGSRVLRTKKNVMKCPVCSYDISDFLKNPQVNREMMGLIESLQRKSEKVNDDEESGGVDEEESEAVDEEESEAADEEQNTTEDEPKNSKRRKIADGEVVSEEEVAVASGRHDSPLSTLHVDGAMEADNSSEGVSINEGNDSSSSSPNAQSN